MSPLIFLATVSFAEDASYDRLFGGESATTSAQAATESMPTAGWAWPALLAGAGLAAAWHLRRKVMAGEGAPGMKVLQRQVLGDKSSLVLVEVADGNGGARRLLLGSSPTGVALVQDLGERLAASEPDRGGLDTAPPVAPAGSAAAAPVAATRARVDAFARVLDEVMEERGLDEPSPVPAVVVDTSFDEDSFFDSAPTSRGTRFFSEDDLAADGPLADDADTVSPAPVRPAVARPAPVAAMPASPPAPAVLRAATPPPVARAPVPRPAPAVVRGAPSPIAPAARAGLVALLGGKSVEAPRGRVFSAAGVRGAPALAAPARPSPRTVCGPTVAVAELREGPPPVRVGPPLQDPRLLAPAAPLTLVSEPGAPEPPVPSTRDLLARLARREQARATGTDGAATRSDALDDRVRRFEAVMAEGGRR